MKKTRNNNMEKTQTSYRRDQRPRHGCEQCGKIVRMHTRISGGWEFHQCPKCGHIKTYRLD